MRTLMGLQHPPVLHCPQNKKCGTNYNVNIIATRIWSKSAPTIPLGHSTLCALSLAPCSPLKPPNDTSLPEKLNQVMI